MERSDDDVVQETLCLLAPSVVGRRWLVQSEQKVVDEESGEEIVKEVVEEKSKDKSINIIERLLESGFELKDKERCVLTRDQACKYLAFSDTDCEPELLQYLTSGPVIALRLAKTNAIADLLEILGPNNPEEAREIDIETFGEEVNRWSLHGAFGSKGIQNGLRGSVSELAASREIAFFFPEGSSRWERVFLLAETANEESVRQQLGGIGICVVSTCQLSPVPEEFKVAYSCLAEVKAVTAFVAEGFSAASKLKRLSNSDSALYMSTRKEIVEQDTEAWFKTLEIERVLLVSFDEKQSLKLERLVREYGFTILAKRNISSREIFSISRKGEIANAFVIAKVGAAITCQCLISEHSSLDVYTSSEYGWLFPQLDRVANLDSTGARSYIRKAETRGSVGSEPQLVQSILVSALTELCKTKPAGLQAVRELGEWLLRNNPDREAAARVDDWIESRKRPSKRPVVPPQAPISDAEVIGMHASRADNSTGKEIIFVLGPPGSGKGTHCAVLAKRFNYEHLSTGDLLRREVELKSEDGKRILEAMQAGALVDTDTTIRLLQKAIRKSEKKCILVDGFPRELEQAERFEAIIGPPSAVLYTSADRGLILDRLMLRMRQDDTPEIIEKRFETYHERSKPVIEHYEKRGLVRAVHQSIADETSEQVFARVLDTMCPEVTFLLGEDASKVDRVAHSFHVAGLEIVDVESMLFHQSKTGSQIGQRIKEIMVRGQKVPTEIILDLLKERMVYRPRTRFVVTSFPRSMEECSLFESLICPAKHVIHLRSKGKQPAQQVQSLIENMKSVGRLTQIDASNCPIDVILSNSGVLTKPRFILSDKPVENPEIVQVTMENIHDKFLAPKTPFLVLGVPTSHDSGHELFECIGNSPYAVSLSNTSIGTENSLIDHFALEGKLRVNIDTERIFKREVVAIFGAKNVDVAVLEQIAAEQGFRLLDFAAAMENLPQCPGTWEGDAVLKFQQAKKQVKSSKSKVIEANFEMAKRRIVQRALDSSYSIRGVMLYNCDDEQFLIRDIVQPSKVVCFEKSAEDLAKEATSKQEEEPDEEALAALTEEFRSSMAALRSVADSCAASPGDVLTVNCSGVKKELILQLLRSGFSTELFSLVAPRSEKTRDLSIYLAKEFGLVRIKVPELFRNEVERGTVAGRAISQANASQSSVPLQTSIGVIQEAVNAHLAAGAVRFILDGYPSVFGDAFPFAHDQLFALEKQVGPVKLCLHLGSNLGTNSSNKVTELFKSMGKYLEMDIGLQMNDIKSAAAGIILKLQSEEETQRRRDHWTPGDGSPEAQLQDILDKFEPTRAEERAAEQHWNEFQKGNTEFETTLEEVTAKMAEWAIEQNPSEVLVEPVVTKAQWYDYEFTSLLMLETAEVRRERERLAKEKAEQEANEGEEE